jgi:hypothetical protein
VANRSVVLSVASRSLVFISGIVADLGVDSLDPLDSLLCQFIKVLATVSSHFLIDFARCTICSGSAKIKPVYLGEVLTYVRDSRGLIIAVNLSLIFFRPSGTSLSDL